MIYEAAFFLEMAIILSILCFSMNQGILFNYIIRENYMMIEKKILEMLMNGELTVEFMREFNQLPETLKKLKLEEIISLRDNTMTAESFSIATELEEHVNLHKTTNGISSTLMNRIIKSNKTVNDYLEMIYEDDFTKYNNELAPEVKKAVAPKETKIPSSKGQIIADLEKEEFFKLFHEMYIEFGYFPNKEARLEYYRSTGIHLDEMISKYIGPYKFLSKFGYIQETMVLDKYAEFLVEKGENTCPHCGSKHLVFANYILNGRTKYRFKCNDCVKTFSLRTYINIEDYKIELAAKSDAKIVWTDSKIPVEWNVPAGIKVKFIPIGEIKKIDKKLDYNLDTFIAKLKNIEGTYGYLPTYSKLEEIFKMQTQFMKFGGYNYIAAQYGFLTEVEYLRMQAHINKTKVTRKNKKAA